MIGQEDKMGKTHGINTPISNNWRNVFGVFLNYFTLLEKRFMGDPIDGGPCFLFLFFANFLVHMCRSFIRYSYI